jgi:hypothetical protein
MANRSGLKRIPGLFGSREPFRASVTRWPACATADRCREVRRRQRYFLLRQSIRAGAKVKSRTLAILTKLPKNIIQAIQKAISQPATESLHTLADNSNDTLILRAA